MEIIKFEDLGRSKTPGEFISRFTLDDGQIIENKIICKDGHPRQEIRLAIDRGELERVGVSRESFDKFLTNLIKEKRGELKWDRCSANLKCQKQ